MFKWIKIALFSVLLAGCASLPIKDAAVLLIDDNINSSTERAMLHHIASHEHPHIQIKSYGGYVDNMYPVIESLIHKATKCSVKEYAMSAAASIFMFCKKRFVHPDALIMFHMVHGGKFKYSWDVPYQAERMKKCIETTMKFRKLFTAVEWRDFLSNKDIWLRGRDLIKRGFALPMEEL